MPLSAPVTSATLPSSLPAALYFGARHRGFCCISASRPGLSSFCRGYGGLGSACTCGCSSSVAAPPACPCLSLRAMVVLLLLLKRLHGDRLQGRYHVPFRMVVHSMGAW